MSLKNDTWCSKEFRFINLGDQRLNRRFLKVASDLLNNPSKPIHRACNGWSQSKAAYRLFDNKNLHEVTLLQLHQQEAFKRAQESDEILLAIQDTTILNYTHHPKKKGVNKINKNVGFEKPTTGFFLHNTLLITEKGCPYGLIDQKIYQHNPEEKAHHKQRPITEKQSFRWIESLQKTKSLFQDRTVVTVSDRESDFFEFFLEAHEIDAKVLVRAKNDRILFQNLSGDEHQTLWPYMSQIVLGGMHTIELPARQNQPERIVNLEVRYAQINLKPPQRYPRAKEKVLYPITLQVVWLYESDSPCGIEPLEWMLLTNTPVNSIKDAICIANWYRLRWQIECYHRILKSGCKIEECRLETYERLKKYVRLKSIIAYRLFYLTMINRVEPDKPCNQILEDHEWKALCCHIAKTKKPPLQPPSIREAVRMIAKLGGFLGRKSDKEPGMSYMWDGWGKLTLIADFWLSNNPEVNCG
jgi:hypothetical protein